MRCNDKVPRRRGWRIARARQKARTCAGFRRHSDGVLEAASLKGMYVAPFSTPFSGFCLRLGSLCKGRDCRCRSPVSGWSHRRFDIATARSGDPDGRFWPSRVFPPGGRCRRIRQSQPPCVPHRHIRRAVWGMKQQDRSDTPSLPPCRRRETIFRRPGAWGFASLPQAPRRSRLAATPDSVSVTGWVDCRHRFGERGKFLECYGYNRPAKLRCLVD